MQSVILLKIALGLVLRFQGLGVDGSSMGSIIGHAKTGASLAERGKASIGLPKLRLAK
jgi:hypothetical protein